MQNAIPIAPEPPAFDYAAVAELFPPRRTGASSWRRLEYKRFPYASEAIQFAMEKLPRTILLGTFLEVGDVRYGHDDIRRLYDDAEYPLARTIPLSGEQRETASR
jgi:hypothetical protein